MASFPDHIFALEHTGSTVALIPHSWPENVANGIDYHVTVIYVWAVRNIPVFNYDDICVSFCL